MGGGQGALSVQRECVQGSAVKAVDRPYSEIPFLMRKAAALQAKSIPGVCRNVPGCSPVETGRREPFGTGCSVTHPSSQQGRLLTGRVAPKWWFSL